MKGTITRQDINFFSDYFITYGKDAMVEMPLELIQNIKDKAYTISKMYNNPDK